MSIIAADGQGSLRWLFCARRLFKGRASPWPLGSGGMQLITALQSIYDKFFV